MKGRSDVGSTRSFNRHVSSCLEGQGKREMKYGLCPWNIGGFYMQCLEIKLHFGDVKIYNGYTKEEYFSPSKIRKQNEVFLFSSLIQFYINWISSQTNGVKLCQEQTPQEELESGYLWEGTVPNLTVL